MSTQRQVIAIVQARMGSTRLPGKVLSPVAGVPMLDRVVRRVGRADSLAKVVVATSDLPQDRLIADYCAEQGWPVFRGSQNDVLDRYYWAATEHGADVVVRVTSDCPLIDPKVIDLVVEALIQTTGADYAACVVPPRTFPRGLDVEAFTYVALERAWRESTEPACREHVTPYINGRPELFSVRGVYARADYSRFRWTVDEPADLRLADAIYGHFGHDRFGWQDVLAAYAQHPEWARINAHVEQKAA